MQRFTLFFVIALFCCFGCEEIPPTLNPQGGGNTGGNTTLENQQKQVIIEEFTGIRCVNCPAGSSNIETLLDIHGERLVAVSLHTGIFSTPYSDSQFDFRTSEGTDIQNYLDAPLGYPTAVVNRIKFDGEESRQTGLSSWAGYIAEELAEEPRVKMEVEHSYDNQTRELSAVVRIHPQEDIIGQEVRVSLFITENNISDKQLTPNGEQSDYIHKHVFRDAVSPFDGRPLSSDLLQGSPVEEGFETTISADWQAENCKIVALVHLNNGEEKDVLQAFEVSLQE